MALAASGVCLGVAAWRLRRALLPGYMGAIGRLAEVVLGLSTLVVVLQVLGTVGLYRPVAAMVAVPAVGVSVAALAPRLGRRGGAYENSSGEGPQAEALPGPGRVWVVVALVVAFVVGAQWVAHSVPGIERGISDLDSLRYHGPFAARWVQQHSITGLERTSAENQESYFPGNIELVDGWGILLFGRDVLTPVRNLAWLGLAFLAAWCGGRRLGHGPAALAGVAAVCSTPLLASIEPGSAKNDIAALALVLAAATLLLHALRCPADPAERSWPRYAVAGLAAGLAAGTKLTAVGPLAVLGMAAWVLVGRGQRRVLAMGMAVPALVTGGFWYLRNVAYTGTPLPWFRLPLGFVTLAGPRMPYDDRFARSVVHYAGSGSFWTGTALPGLLGSFGVLWPVLVVGAIGAALAAGRRRAPTERLIGVAALGAVAAYVVTPWGAGGPEGVPSYFAPELRFLAPALGLAAIAAAARPRLAGAAVAASAVVVAVDQVEGRGAWPAAVGRTVVITVGLAAVALVVWWATTRLERLAPRRLGALGALGTVVVALGAVGWPMQRDYLADRYASDHLAHGITLPMFRQVSHKRVAVGGFADDYQLYGPDLSNHVQYVGVEEPDGSYRRVATCREWLSGLAQGHYDYVVVGVTPAARHHPTEPPEEEWTELSRVARMVVDHGLTTVFRLVGRPDPASCPATHLLQPQ